MSARSMHPVYENAYRVEFLNYTDPTNQSVKNSDGEYLMLPEDGEDLVISESKLNDYRCYGGGFRSVIFVGKMIVEDSTK